MMDEELPLEIGVEDLNGWLRAGRTVTVVDVREPWERDICALVPSAAIPLRDLPARVAELPRDCALVLLCHHGGRSAQATMWLRRQGYDNAINLEGGIDAWARRIDPTMKVY